MIRRWLPQPPAPDGAPVRATGLCFERSFQRPRFRTPYALLHQCAPSCTTLHRLGDPLANRMHFPGLPSQAAFADRGGLCLICSGPIPVRVGSNMAEMPNTGDLRCDLSKSILPRARCSGPCVVSAIRPKPRSPILSTIRSPPAPAASPSALTGVRAIRWSRSSMMVPGWGSSV